MRNPIDGGRENGFFSLPDVNHRRAENICRQSTSVLVLIQEKGDVFFVYDNLIKYSKINEILAFMTKQYDFSLIILFLNRIRK
jgi:hypothetical protein